MRELGEIREGGGPEVEQMLALQIAPGPLAGDRGDTLGAMLGQNRAVPWLKFPPMLGTETTGHNSDARAIEIERARQADRVRRHRVRMAVVHHHAHRADTHGNAERQVRGRDLQRT